MNRRNLLPVLLLGSGLGLLAQDSRVGAQLHLSAPGGELKSEAKAKTSLGGGLHLILDLGKGHVLRPRLDVTRFKGELVTRTETVDIPVGPAPVVVEATASAKIDTTQIFLGADYLYFPAGKAEGAYLLGGFGAVRWKVDGTLTMKVPAFGLSGTESRSDHTTRLGLAAGLGYQFTKRMGGELRYTRASLGDGDKGTAVQVSWTLRF